MKLKRVKVLIHRVGHRIRNIEHKLLARCAVVGHLTYYGLVSVEAHGFYRYAAGAVGILLIFEALQNSTHGGPDE